MKFLSICSGIEAASVAWCPLGWECVGVAEIAPFPSAVLAHHFPEVINYGDFTKIETDSIGPIDLLVGGTPCQSFSIAGLRGGLADCRGNLALEFLRLADRTRPRWLLWENVPGVLSSNGGRDFGSILGGMVELGYGFAYRILDAQFFGLAQRRKRVFVIGYLGDWRPAAAVLFERESLSGHPPPHRQAGQDLAPTISARTQDGGGLGTDFDLDGELITHALRAEGFGASEDGTGRGTPIVPVYIPDVSDTLVARSSRGGGQTNSPGHNVEGTLLAFGGNRTSGSLEVAAALNGKGGTGRMQFETETLIAFDCKAGGNTGFAVGDTPGALRGEGHGGGHAAVANCAGVRRLTPRECERLMGFPDDFTLIPLPLRGRQSRVRWAADGSRYKALGNSIAVPCLRWIGQRIDLVEALLRSHDLPQPVRP
jgi:DNA (cytosine-5)-methyltransferase 1